MEVSAGISTDKPASGLGVMGLHVFERLAQAGCSQAARAVLFVACSCPEEKPIHYGATTSFVQVPDTHFHPMFGS